MLTWAVVTSSGGGSIDVRRARSALGSADIPIAADDTVTWENATRTIAFVGAQTKPPLTQMQSHWHVDDRGITAFSGHVWPRAGPFISGEPWAAQLHRFLQREAEPEELFGIFTVARLRSDGESRIFADAFGAGLVYIAQAEAVTVISNRAALAARLTSGEGVEPIRDATGVGWLCFFNHVLDSTTSFTGVRALRPGEQIRIDRRGTVTITSKSLVARLEPVGHTAAELAERAYGDLVSSIRQIAYLETSARVVALSGGKDSRLIASAVLGESLQDRFEFETNGEPTHPDVAVGKEIAERFDLLHRVRPPTARIPTADEYFEAVRSHAYLTSGMLGAAYLRGGVVRLTDETNVGGMFGETLRSHYAGTRKIKDRHDLAWFVRNELPFDPAGILKDDVRRAFVTRVTEWVDTQLDSGVAPEDVPDAFYLEHRIPRWVGHINEFHRGLLVHPLQSMNAVRWGTALGAEARRQDSLHFQLMRRAFSPITKVPFAEDDWHPANYRRLRDAAEYARVKPCTATLEPSPRGSTWPVVRTCLRDYVLGDRQHPVFDIVDYERFSDAIGQAGRLPATARASLYNLLGIAVWLGRDERVAAFNDASRGPVRWSERLQGVRMTSGAATVVPTTRLGRLIPRGHLRFLRRRLFRMPVVRRLARSLTRRDG